jgi:hypothetical protein
MAADLGAGYVGESSVGGFLERVGHEYRNPRGDGEGQLLLREDLVAAVFAVANDGYLTFQRSVASQMASFHGSCPMRDSRVPLSRQEVGDDEPLRLEVAAALAFPDGSMKASGLRREAAKGKLALERIAHKDYTTLRAIAEMRKKCRVEAKVQDSGCNLPEKTAGEKSSNRLCLSSGKDQRSAALDAARAKLSKLRQHSVTTSTQSPRSDSATVTHLPLPSRT